MLLLDCQTATGCACCPRLLQTAASSATVGQSMQTAGKAMAAIGAKNDPHKMMQNLQQFRWVGWTPRVSWTLLPVLAGGWK